MPQTAEEFFVTRVYDDTFDIIEDEQGDVWWGYGHQDAEKFTDEVNRWLIRECGITDPDDLFPRSQAVEHLWAQFDPGDDNPERFKLVTYPDPEAGVFPVTRLMG
jgi:hypothetical protein